MIRHAVLLIALKISLTEVETVKQQVQLSDSYLPVAMQVIAHITDQMAFEVKEDLTPKPPTKPTTKPTTRPTTKPTTRPATQSTTRPTTNWTTRPTTKSTTRPTTQWTTRPTTRPTTTARPTVTNSWWTSYTTTTRRTELTTPYHKPGLYAPYSPPKPSEYIWKDHPFVLLPMQQYHQHKILAPKEVITEEPLLAVQQETVKPLVQGGPQSSALLPPHYFVKISSRSDGYVVDEYNEENLQYLSEDLREMIKMARDPHDDKLLDVWEDVRQGSQPITSKAKLSATNLRLLLLYDLLSREAKRQRLSDYSGFSPDVMKNLVDNSSSARQQLKMALSKMVERHDCGHEYANNRAKEMVEELGKDESGMSAELRYLQPLIYKY